MIGLHQYLPVVGMRNPYQCLRRLLKFPTKEVNYSIPGYYPVYMSSGSNYSCTLLKKRYYPRESF